MHCYQCNIFYIALLTERIIVNIPEPVQYVIYTLAVPCDLRCESGTLFNGWDNWTDKYIYIYIYILFLHIG